VFKREPFYICNKSDGASPPGWTLGISPATQIDQTVAGLTSSALPFPNYYDIAWRSTFALNDLANMNNFCLMYDQYKITGVKMEITFLQNTAEATSIAVMPTLNITTDQDDSTLPSSAIQLLGKQGVRKFNFGSKGRTKFSMKFRPNPVQPLQANSTSSTAIINASVPQKLTWIDCLNPAVPHFAVKAYFENVLVSSTASYSSAFKVDLTYYVSFKQPLQCS